MREIKFRAWDKKRKKMWYPENMQRGDMVDHKNCGNLMSHDIEQLAIGANGEIYILDECGNCEYSENIGEDYEIMWFIGMEDKNKKEIYEGDVVRWKEEGAVGEALLGQVVWGLDGFVAKELNKPTWEYLGGTFPFSRVPEFYNFSEGIGREFEWDELEIIGNIWENPELLKEV